MSSIILLALIGGGILGIAVVGYLYIKWSYCGYEWFTSQLLQPKSLMGIQHFGFTWGYFSHHLFTNYL